MKRALTRAVLLVALVALLAAPAVSLPQEYTVEPAFGATGTPAADLAPVTFWDLSLREMAIILALAVSPLLLAPMEILFAAKLLSLLAFRRIARANVLDNTVRNAIYGRIRQSPGICTGTLAEAAGVSRGALAYHLALLAALNKIVLVKNHGAVCCFENSGAYSREEQRMKSCLRSGTGRAILRILAATPGLSRQELGEALCVSGPTVTWHMKRLEADGAVQAWRDGRFSRYALSGGMAALLERAGPGELPGGMSPAGQGITVSRAARAGPVES